MVENNLMSRATFESWSVMKKASKSLGRHEHDFHAWTSEDSTNSQPPNKKLLFYKTSKPSLDSEVTGSQSSSSKSSSSKSSDSQSSSSKSPTNNPVAESNGHIKKSVQIPKSTAMKLKQCQSAWTIDKDLPYRFS